MISKITLILTTLRVKRKIKVIVLQSPLQDNASCRKIRLSAPSAGCHWDLGQWREGLSKG